MARKGLLPHAGMLAVDKEGPRWGRYRGEFERLNFEDFRVGALPRWASAGLLRSRRKAWQHIAIFSADFWMSVAAVDAGLLNSAFVCFVDRATGQVLDYSRVRLPGVAHIPDKQVGEAFGWRTRDLTISYKHTSGLAGEVTVSKPGPTPEEAVHANLTLAPADPASPSLVSLLPFPSGMPFYSLKGPCRASGRVVVGKREYDLDPERDFVLVDYHRACYPWRTFWQWVTLAWRTPDGRCAALNLTRNIIDDEAHGNENALWLGESLEELSPARFTIPSDPMLPWQVLTADGSVNLEFKPLANRKDATGGGPISSAYVQVFGHFYGSVVTGGGERLLVDGVPGVAEDHKVRW